jgi:uncharacterized protein
MYLERSITAKLKKLAEYFPAVVVTGARQVGKSTLVKHVFGQQAEYILFDSVFAAENVRQEPDLFLQNHRTPLILDEIQYAPELVSSLKRKIDQNRSPGQYILTGSQQWAVMKSISESLAGRAVFLDLEGFSLQEIAKNSSDSWLMKWLADPQDFIAAPKNRLTLDKPFYELLWRGSLPEAAFLPLDIVPDFQAGYFRTYIERDAQQFADLSDWNLFGRFVKLAAALTAQEIHFSQLGRELGLTPQTARRWLNILKATFQWFEIPAFSSNLIKRVSSKPKGYIADTALICNAQAITTPNVIAGHPLYGAIFETAVIAEIRKQCALLPSPIAMYHWRTYRGAEVDLILEKDGKYFPIEIKANSRPARRDTNGLCAFRNAYPKLDIAPGLILAPCPAFLKVSDSDYALPWDTCL